MGNRKKRRQTMISRFDSTASFSSSGDSYRPPKERKKAKKRAPHRQRLYESYRDDGSLWKSSPERSSRPSPERRQNSENDGNLMRTSSETRSIDGDQRATSTEPLLRAAGSPDMSTDAPPPAPCHNNWSETDVEEVPEGVDPLADLWDDIAELPRKQTSHVRAPVEPGVDPQEQLEIPQVQMPQNEASRSSGRSPVYTCIINEGLNRTANGLLNVVPTLSVGAEERVDGRQIQHQEHHTQPRRPNHDDRNSQTARRVPDSLSRHTVDLNWSLDRNLYAVKTKNLRNSDDQDESGMTVYRAYVDSNCGPDDDGQYRASPLPAPEDAHLSSYLTMDNTQREDDSPIQAENVDTSMSSSAAFHTAQSTCTALARRKTPHPLPFDYEDTQGHVRMQDASLTMDHTQREGEDTPIEVEKSPTFPPIRPQPTQEILQPPMAPQETSASGRERSQQAPPPVQSEVEVASASSRPEGKTQRARKKSRPAEPKAPPPPDFFSIVGGRTGNLGQFNVNTYGNSRVFFSAFGDFPRLPKREPPEVVTLSSDDDVEENPTSRKRKPAGGDPLRSRSEDEKGRHRWGRLSAGGDTRPPSFEGRVYDDAVEKHRETGNMFHTDDVSEQLSHLLLENVTKEHRKFLNKVIWDLEQVPLDQRDDHNLLPVKDAVVHLKGLIVQKKAEGVTPKQLLEQSVWIHKVLHEYLFAPEIDDYVIRAYIERRLAVGHESVTVDDFYLDSDNLVHYMIAPLEKSKQYLSIVKFRVNSENFLEAVTHDDLLNSLANKYAESGMMSNGVLCQLRITLLVNVIQETKPSQGSAVTHQQSRNALLEELPYHSKQNNAFVAQAKTAAENISDALAQKLTGVDLSAHVIVYHEGKPLTQVDLLGAESLELWRLPEEAKLESDRMSNVNVFKLDDEKEKRFCRLFVRENVELPIRETDKWKESIPAEITNHIDNACGAVNVTMRNFKKMLFVANHVLMFVSFPKMPIEFTRDSLDLLEEYIIECIRAHRDILYQHHVTEVEVVFAKVCSDGSQLIKHRVIFRNETGVTPEFGVYEENKRQITPLRLSHQLYGKSLEVHGRIMKIEKKRVTTIANGTTYVYDLPSLFGSACLDERKKYFDNVENSDDADSLAQFQRVFTTLSKQQQAAYTRGDYRKFFTKIELVLKDGVLIEVDRKEEPKRRADDCNNETGVVAWKLRLFTPEKPKGFDVVVVANDITCQSGSFATQEDEIYQLASVYSRQRKIPRANVFCNSGARIGLAEDVSKIFTNSENPLEGFDYIYVDGDDEALIKGQVSYEKLPNGTLKLTGVIGRKNEQIGVETL